MFCWMEAGLWQAERQEQTRSSMALGQWSGHMNAAYSGSGASRFLVQNWGRGSGHLSFSRTIQPTHHLSRLLLIPALPQLRPQLRTHTHQYRHCSSHFILLFSPGLSTSLLSLDHKVKVSMWYGDLQSHHPYTHASGTAQRPLEGTPRKQHSFSWPHPNCGPRPPVTGRAAPGPAANSDLPILPFLPDPRPMPGHEPGEDACFRDP